MTKRGAFAMIVTITLIATLLSALPTARSVEDIYFVAVNDTLKPLDRRTMPFLKDGYYYVSYKLFSDSTLGVYHSYSNKQYTLTLYNKDYQITFDSLSGVAYDRNEQYQMKLAGNSYGEIFLPIAFVCEKFGLTFEDVRTSPARTLRVSTHTGILSAEDFREENKAEMATAYLNFVFPPSPSPSPPPTSGITTQVPPTSPPSVSAPPSPSPTPTTPKIAYLTFDGGPGEYTDQVLDLLKNDGVAATFFLCGNDIAANPDLVRRMVGEGHAVGLHCLSHDDATLYSSPDEFLAQLSRALELLDAATGTKTRLLRFPGGSKGAGVTAEIRDAVVDAGFRYWDFSVDGSDGGRTSRALSNAVINGLSGRIGQPVGVVRLECTETTVAALPRILNYIDAENYTVRFATVSEMPRNLWNDVRTTLAE